MPAIKLIQFRRKNVILLQNEQFNYILTFFILDLLLYYELDLTETSGVVTLQKS